ncbi:MAG: hypothetical protein ACRC9V_15005, partial [Aeromonas sp.]
RQTSTQELPLNHFKKHVDHTSMYFFQTVISEQAQVSLFSDEFRLRVLVKGVACKYGAFLYISELGWLFKTVTVFKEVKLYFRQANDTTPRHNL